mgnify:CR=1 FL=1
MEFEAVIGILAKAAGLKEGFVPQADGSVVVGAPDLFVTFKELPAIGALMMRSELGDLPEKGSDRLAAMLLQENFMGRGAAGGTFSVGEGRKVFVHRLLPLATADEEAILGEFGGFVNVAREWKRIVGDYAAKVKAD